MNRDQIIAAATPKTKVVSVPEWGGTVTIRQLTAGQIVYAVNQDERTAIARTIAASLVDDDDAGVLCFQDTPEDLKVILGFGFSGCLTLNKEINEFNGVVAVNGSKNS